MSNWPNFFIVGASKAGTTSLYLYLEKTKGIFMSPVKEPLFFAPSLNKYKRFASITNEKEYLNLFKGVKNERVIGEASTGYLTDQDSPELIHQKIPNAKIIIILRNPIHRAYSYYLHNVRNGSETISFREAVNCEQKKIEKTNTHRHYIGGSMYYIAVKKYLELFGKDNVMIIVFEEFIEDTYNSVIKVIKFLGIDSKPPKEIDDINNSFRVARGPIVKKILSNSYILKAVRNAKISQSKIQWIREKILEKKIEKPKLDEEDCKYVRKILYDDVQNLKKLTNLNFPWDGF
ncbi:sulfotransferase family protein [Nitrosopumilus sp. S4]